MPRHRRLAQQHRAPDRQVGQGRPQPPPQQAGAPLAINPAHFISPVTDAQLKDAKIRVRNYASSECGAKVIASNSEAEGAYKMLQESMDEYMLNPCSADIWFLIELCEPIQLSSIQVANYELFSSTFNHFSVFTASHYPTHDWQLVAHLQAADTKNVQLFPLPRQSEFRKFVKLQLHSHHGKEHYCPFSLLRVFGVSMVEEFDALEQKPGGHFSHSNFYSSDQILVANNGHSAESAVSDGHAADLHSFDNIYRIDSESDAQKSANKPLISANLLGTARDAVLGVLRKAAFMFGKYSGSGSELSASNVDKSVAILLKDEETVEAIIEQWVMKMLPILEIHLRRCPPRSRLPRSRTKPLCNYLRYMLGTKTFDLLRKELRKPPSIRFKCDRTKPVSDKTIRDSKLANDNCVQLGQDSSITKVFERAVDKNSELHGSTSMDEQQHSVTSVADLSTPANLHTPAAHEPSIAPTAASISILSLADTSAAFISTGQLPSIPDLQTASYGTDKNEQAPINSLPNVPLNHPPFAVSGTITPTTNSEEKDFSRNLPHPSSNGQLSSASLPSGSSESSITSSPASVSTTGSSSFSSSASSNNGNAASPASPPSPSSANGHASNTPPVIAAQPLPSGQHSPPPLSGSASKESIFVRMSNKIRSLELNLSLSSQYLEELSQRYRRQMEEMQRNFNQTVFRLNESARLAAEKDNRQQTLLDRLSARIEQLENLFYLLTFFVLSRFFYQILQPYYSTVRS